MLYATNGYDRARWQISWVAAKNATLFAIPHCVIFPPGPESNLPGRNRDASQMPVFRIPGLSDYFWYLEDDIVPIKPMRQSDWYPPTYKLLRLAATIDTELCTRSKILFWYRRLMNDRCATNSVVVRQV